MVAIAKKAARSTSTGESVSNTYKFVVEVTVHGQASLKDARNYLQNSWCDGIEATILETAKPSKAGVLYMHTVKAVRKAQAPEDRVFFVVPWSLLPEAERGHAKGNLLAWKGKLLPGNKIQHPLLDKPISVTSLSEHPELWGLAPKGSLSAPTAEFKPDSFYRKVQIVDATLQ